MRLPPLASQSLAPNDSQAQQAEAKKRNAPMPPVEAPAYTKQPRHKDPVSHAVHTYLRTGVLPATDFEVPIPGPNTGPGRGMTGCITSNHIIDYAKDWYIGSDGELYQNGTGPGPVRFDEPVLGVPPEPQGVKEIVMDWVGLRNKEQQPFSDWND
ncbi:hypothetical protein PhCBS80983_g02545 [Powellomyces hirtus]|uniref:Uncharacterized protein n=1 Tax=Powellomyces hirtus TaxID=109895 RepID=A0A507E7U4_9FUNG|nr:hypothetical protein PhCBS80983_g02545 [Powellomyces hirtus]